MRHSSTFLVGSVIVSAMLLLRCGGDSSDGNGGGNDQVGTGGSVGTAGAPADDVCEPGATQACVGPAQCEGGQACRADGSGWDTCDCGAASTGGSGGAIDGTGGSGATTPCVPMDVSSCAAGKRCEAVGSGDPENVTFELTCVDEGEGLAGTSCATNTECVAGTGCGGNTCRAFCDVNGGCGSEELCQQYQFSGDVFLGLCEPTCALLGDDCSASQVCIPNQTSATCVSAVSNVAVGEPCTLLNDCVSGAACVLFADDPGGLCLELCATTTAGNCPGDLACIPLQETTNFAEFALPGVGLCMPCDSGTCDLLRAGGCVDSTDCDPVSVEFGRTYTCDASMCVEAPPL